MMDITNRNLGNTMPPGDELDFSSSLIGWFSVSGDMDDFIFYGDEAGPSAD